MMLRVFLGYLASCPSNLKTPRVLKTSFECDTCCMSCIHLTNDLYIAGVVVIVRYCYRQSTLSMEYTEL